MLKRGFLKPELSITNLGVRRFWTGIIMGILFSFSISYLFNYSREIFRFITLVHDPFVFPEIEFRLYDLFFAAFSSSLGLGITIVIWMNGTHVAVRKKYLIYYTIANAWFITFAVLGIVARFGSLMPIILYTFGYDNHLNFIDLYWYMLIMIPVFVFFTQWNAIRLVYKTKHWIIISVIFCAITTFYLYHTTTADRSILNLKVYLMNKNRTEFIESEFNRAEQYNIHYSDSTYNALLRRHTIQTKNLVLKLKDAFHKDKVVPLDTLILEKIAIHNMNHHGQYNRRRFDRDGFWSYAYPEEVFSQIKKHDVKSIETKILFEILNEQAMLFDVPEIDRENWWNLSHYEKERHNYQLNLLYSTETIQCRLYHVIDFLKSDTSFRDYHHILPDFEINTTRGRQCHVDLKLE